jgi:hypothetical protein
MLVKEQWDEWRQQVKQHEYVVALSLSHARFLVEVCVCGTYSATFSPYIELGLLSVSLEPTQFSEAKWKRYTPILHVSG